MQAAPGTDLAEIDALCDITSPTPTTLTRLTELMVRYDLSTQDLAKRFEDRKAGKLSPPSRMESSL